MIAVFLAPFYILLCTYLFIKGIKWLGACHGFFAKKRIQGMIGGGYLFLAFSILIAFLMPESEARRVMKLIGGCWLGILLYLALSVLSADFLHFILKHIPCMQKSALFSKKGHAAVGSVCFISVLLFTVTGIVSAGTIHTTEYEITVEKECSELDSLNVVLVADLHLGYNIGQHQMRQMVEKINMLQPDLVIVAGDIFDNEYEAIENPEETARVLHGIQSKYGVYACYGNHDIQEPILAGFTFGQKGEKKVSDPRMDAFMEKAGFRLLREEAVLIDNAFYVYGRPDYERPGRGIDRRKTPQELAESMDMSKPVIVMDHEPRELQELADAGVDVDLCGHTHDGQLFPGNLLINLLWENSCGYLKKGDMHNIVISGVGVFGTYMRVGTKSEICHIKINFAPEK